MSSHLAFSRKYGTVWYHPASSKLWNLTALSFVKFQGKLTGTSRDLFACEASLFGLLCAWREVQILRQQPSEEPTVHYLVASDELQEKSWEDSSTG
jgi:hypothetical protein